MPAFSFDIRSARATKNTAYMDNYLKKYWARYFRYDWKLGVFLILLFGIPRFVIVLHAYVTRSYGTVMFVFLAMWLAPFLLLTPAGRKGIGMRRPSSWLHTGIALLAGGLICYLLFGLFSTLYGHSIDNPFVYIGGNNPTSALPEETKTMYFWIAVIPSMLFSPIGEELLYRGIIHGCFVPRFGEVKASVFDSLAFALTHLAHFGIVYTSASWHFALLPSLLWIVSMFVVSQLFFRCKCYGGSILGAMVAHAGFNFVMMYGIFYWL